MNKMGKFDRDQYKIATGNVIKKHRKKHNISQDQLAYFIGVNKSTISRYENGSMDIPASNLPLICKECSFSPSEYAIAWMKVSSDNVPKEKKAAYTAAVGMIEEIIEQIDNLINTDYQFEDKLLLSERPNIEKANQRLANYLKYYVNDSFSFSL